MFIYLGMNKYKKPSYNEKDLGVNPFVSSLVIHVNEIAFKQNYQKDEDIIVPKFGRVEVDVSCRVYISASRRKLMNELSSRAKELLLWVIYEVDPNKDYMWLNKRRYMEESGIASINTFKAALKDLIAKGFICPSTVSGIYWINPAIFYSGNRITSYPKNVEILYSEKDK